MADLTNLRAALAAVEMELRYLDAQITSDRATLALALTKAQALTAQLSAGSPPDPDEEILLTDE